MSSRPAWTVSGNQPNHPTNQSTNQTNQSTNHHHHHQWNNNITPTCGVKSPLTCELVCSWGPPPGLGQWSSLLGWGWPGRHGRPHVGLAHSGWSPRRGSISAHLWYLPRVPEFSFLATGMGIACRRDSGRKWEPEMFRADKGHQYIKAEYWDGGLGREVDKHAQT